MIFYVKYRVIFKYSKISSNIYKHKEIYYDDDKFNKIEVLFETARKFMHFPLKN